MNDPNKVKPKPKPLIRGQSVPAFKLSGDSTAGKEKQQQHLQIARPSAEESTTDTRNSPQLKKKPKPKPLLRAESVPTFNLSGKEKQQQHLQVARPSADESITDTTNSPQLKKKLKPKPLLRVESVPIFNLSGKEKTEEKTTPMPKPKPLLRGQSLPIFNLTGDKTAEMARQRRFASEATSTLRMSGTSMEYKKQEITDKPIGRPITMFAPSDSADHGAKKEPTLPTEMLRAEWVYGYRGRDCADNLHELGSGEIVYNIASVVVLYDPRAGTQRHYLGHNSSIQCLAVHPAGVLVTSGQVMGVNRREQIAVYEKFDGFYGTPDPNWYKPHVRVWDSKTLQTLAVIGGDKLQFGVCAVSFSVSVSILK
ncbi:hypothetical protein Bbelb_367430 [Branchiostoma belcheri]|nr:hypothetical protein Bbelb_367430 [Branchiostoma belcheri]